MTSENYKRHIKKFTGNMHSLPHHLMMAPNLQSNLHNVDFENFYKPFPFESSLPVPVSNSCTGKSIDPCTQYIKNKETWKNKIQTMKGIYKKISIDKQITELDTRLKKATIPIYLLNFAKLLREDPDKYFDSKYNWYFSGKGNLCEMKKEDDTYLLTSVGNELRCHSMNKVGEDFQSLYSCNSKDSIFETATAESSSDYLVALRQRNNISVLSLFSDSDSVLKNDCITSIESDDIPIVSVSLNDSCKNVCYALIDSSVHIEDLRTNKSFEIYSKDSDVTQNNWSSVEYINENCIVFIGTKSIKLLDNRTERKPDGSISLPPSINCERITCSKLGAKKECGSFLGTTHSLYFCDWRYLDENCFITKWTHGFKSAPVHITTTTSDNQELICVSSQFSNELSMVFNTLMKDSNFDAMKETEDLLDVSCNYSLWRPPCIHDTLIKSQLKGMCLDPMIGLKKRFNSLKTGNILIPSENAIKLYTLNSVGDIFSQILHKKGTSIDDNDDCERLNVWANTIQQYSFPLVVSSKSNMYHSFTRMTASMKPYNRNEIVNEKGFMKYKKNWKKSLANLNDYSDICANELLSVWDIYENRKETETIVSQSANTKFTINAWMKQFDLFDDSIQISQ